MKWGLLTFLLIWMPSGEAAIEAFEFANSAQEARYRALTSELRCPKCQNQAVSDSNAELSADFRQRVFEMIQANQSDTEIVEYFVSRYGDFVIYRPPLRPGTFLLWFGPIIFVFLSTLGVAIWIARRNATQGPLSEQERNRLAQLLSEPKS